MSPLTRRTPFRSPLWIPTGLGIEGLGAIPAARSLNGALRIGTVGVSATFVAMKGSKPGARKKATAQRAASVAAPRNQRFPISSE